MNEFQRQRSKKSPDKTIEVDHQFKKTVQEINADI